MSEKTKIEITLYTDGVSARWKNTRISLTEQGDGGFVIKFSSVEKLADKPACLHQVDRHIVRRTYIGVSRTALEALHAMTTQYLRHKSKPPPEKQP